MNTKNEALFKDNLKLMYSAIEDLKYIPEEYKPKGKDKRDYEELEQQAKLILWEAILDYDEDIGTSLSSHCYSRVYYRLINWLEKVQAKKRKYNKINTDINDTQINKYAIIENELMGDLLIEEIGKHIGDMNTNILIDKYIYQYQNKELAAVYSVNEKTIRRRLKKSLCVLKNELQWDMDTSYDVA